MQDRRRDRLGVLECRGERNAKGVDVSDIGSVARDQDVTFECETRR